MGIRFACHVCQKPLNIKSELAGKRGLCPQCGARFRIPSDDAAISIPLEDSGVVTTSELSPSDVPAVQPAVANLQPVAATVLPSLLDDASAVWYIRPPSGGQYGPATGEMLRGWISEARVTPTSLVWRDGWAQWRSAAETLAEFGATSSPVPTPPSKAVVRPHFVAPVPVAPTVTGDATIGSRKSKVAGRRFVIVGGLAALSMTLIGILIFLIQRS